MYPILIKFGSITVHTYGFLLAVGVLLAILLSLKLGKQEGLDSRLLSDFIFYTILVGLLGAKLFLLVTEIDHYMRHPGEVFSLLTSAGTFYGGLIFGGLFVVWYSRKHKLNLTKIADVLAPAVALGHFFGRMACFSAGCCWGRDAAGCPIAVTFTSPETTTGVPHNIPLYPTQLIESILNLLNFVVLLILTKKKKFQGQVIAVYIFNYSLIRFGVEYFRGDHDRGYLFGSMDHPFSSLSIPQFISIIGVMLAIIIYVKAGKKGKSEV